MEFATSFFFFLVSLAALVEVQAIPSEEVISDGSFFPPTKPQERSNRLLKQNPRYKPTPISCRANDTVIGVSLLSGISDERYRWSTGFFVQADWSFNRREMRLINDAMYELNQILCIPVNMWTRNSRPVGDYAFIRKGPRGSGCYSPIGRIGGRQIINLEAGGRCVNKATIMHEAIHSLGFNHEQTRPDRDNYVKIYWRNILPGMDYNFRKFRGALTYDIPYDYNSIMHYDGYAFSRNGRPTIAGKNGRRIGFNSVLTPYDIERLRKMYNCEDNPDYVEEITETPVAPEITETPVAPEITETPVAPEISETPVAPEITPTQEPTEAIIVEETDPVQIQTNQTTTLRSVSPRN